MSLITQSNLYDGIQVIISNNGSYQACINGSKLILRSLLNKENTILNVFQCLDKIDKIRFSPDSNLIFAQQINRSCVQIFSLKDFSWTCRINEGSIGIFDTHWFNDSQRIIVEANFGINLSVWSLIDSSQSIITYPKNIIENCDKKILNFSSCGKYMVVLHRIDLQDFIALYVLNPLTESNRFKAKTNDVAVVQFLPNDTHILTLESPLNYKCCLYSPSGELIAMFEGYQNALGVSHHFLFNPIKSALPSDAIVIESRKSIHNELNENDVDSFNAPLPVAILLSHDNKIRILNLFSLQLLYVLPLVNLNELPEGINLLDVATSVEINGNNSDSKESLNSITNLDLQNDTTSFVKKILKKLPVTSSSTSSSSSSSSVVSNSFSVSSDGRFVAASDGKTIWIYSVTKGVLLDHIVLLDNITNLKFSPYDESKEHFLLIATGTSVLYYWTPSQGIRRFQNNFPLKINKIKWIGSSTSNSPYNVLLSGKESFLFTYISNNFTSKLYLQNINDIVK